MQKYVLGILILFTVIAGVLVVNLRRQPPVTSVPSPVPSVSISSPATPSLPSPSLTATPTPVPTLFYPMPRYGERLTERRYSQRITQEDDKGLVCGGGFTGFHTGDDLETFPEEQTVDVPVYSIASGVVRQASRVGGYGGLLVIEHDLPDKKVVAYYGHIDLNHTLVKAGDPVTAGQQVTILGDGCSTETANQRKHLHFDVRESTKIDVRGYVPSEADLAAWINPQELLQNAASPH